MKKLATGLAVASLLIAPGSAPSQDKAPVVPASVNLPPDLSRVLADYEGAWQKRDAAALAELFTEDGFVLSQGAPPVRGRAAIKQHYIGKGGPLALRALAFQAEGSIAYIIGAYAMRRGEPDAGKFTLTLHKVAAGRWLIFSDMDNSNGER